MLGSPQKFGRPDLGGYNGKVPECSGRYAKANALSLYIRVFLSLLFLIIERGSQERSSLARESISSSGIRNPAFLTHSIYSSMALVFKVKFQGVLRRWVASESLTADSFSITFGLLEDKIKELFNLSPSALLAITYVDKDNDVVMLADDQDVVDACIVQRLNPLRLDVQVRSDNSSSKELSRELPRSSDRPSSENVNIGAFLNAIFPRATADAVQSFLRTYTPFIDPKLPAATCLAKAENAFKEFLNGLAARHSAHPKFPERFAPHMHPGAASSRPHRGDTSFHWGIECDGCGISPLEGPRYKSIKKTDYDLCANCFKTSGNDKDYEKLDRPVYHHPHGHNRPPCFRRGPRPFPAPPGCRASFTRGPYGWKPNHPFPGHQASGSAPSDEHKKLDARFVKDVTIFDGTELAPGSKFTKIWRMSNIGTRTWPQSTQLVHIGGDRLCPEETVTLELPEGGLPCGEEVEVSVDLAAPEKAGRYVSHWRLAAPSGQKFGHRVWVVIHVVPEGEHSPQFQASLQNGESSLGAIKEAMDVDFNGANIVTVDVDLNGANTVVLDVVFDGETVAIEEVAEAAHNDYENEHPSIVFPDPVGHGSRDVDMPIQKPVEEGVVFDVETPAIEELAPGKAPHMEDENGHPSIGYADPFAQGSRDVDMPIEKPVELGGVVDDETAAFEQLSVEKSTPYEQENVHPLIVYPDLFARGSRNVDMSVEKPVGVGVTASVVYPDPTSYDLKDVDISREKLSEGGAGRKNEVDGFSLVEKPTENNDWFEVIENEDHTPEGLKEGEEEAAMESLLQALESMGFADRSVNTSVLQNRNFVLQDAVDDLLTAAGWDGALKELEEMGFNESSTNIRLLAKNKGSLKQTVRDLVKMEKAVEG